MSRSEKAWFLLDPSASLPVMALMLPSPEGEQAASSGTGLGAGCVAAASTLWKGQQEGKMLARLGTFC